MKPITMSSMVMRSLARREPFLWLNEHRRPLLAARAGPQLGLNHVVDAEMRLNRFAGLLASLFPELVPTRGIIESPARVADALPRAMLGARSPQGRWMIKEDHALPVAGSVKARGGIYEVLVHAEDLALKCGLLRSSDDDPLTLASPKARALFARHRIAVGSTGNLGLSIGVVAAALGFHVVVHMSSDAKAWKKARLRACGVEVMEHDGDYGAAISAGRAAAQRDSNTYFVDDENSERLFLGYSTAAIRLRRQLAAHDIQVNIERPLFVYLPCGVGGAPGGITFGLRHLFGDHVHCFFSEPVESACMLIRLASGGNGPISVRDVGLDNRTIADGLAVGQASEFVAKIVEPLVSGVFTVRDCDLFEDLYLLEQKEGLRVEPSAAAALRGPVWLLETEAGQRYLSRHDLSQRMSEATHLIWTTGGALVPREEYRGFHDRGRKLWMARSVTKSS